MLISRGVKISHRVVVWELHALQLKIRDICKIPNKFLNIGETLEVVVKSKDGPLPSSVVLSIINV